MLRSLPALLALLAFLAYPVPPTRAQAALPPAASCTLDLGGSPCIGARALCKGVCTETTAGADLGSCPKGAWNLPRCEAALSPGRDLHYVSRDGLDPTGGTAFDSIREAVLVAAPGDVVCIAKGTWDEEVVTGREVALVGACPGGTRIRGKRYGISVEGAEQVVIENLSVSGAEFYGVQIVGSRWTTLLDLEIEGNGVANVMVSGSAPLQSTGTRASLCSPGRPQANVEVCDSTIRCGIGDASGIYAHGSPGLVVLRTVVERSGGSGVEVVRGSVALVGSRLRGTRGALVVREPTAALRVANNEITDSLGSAVFVRRSPASGPGGHAVDVRRNVLDRSLGSGLTVADLQGGPPLVLDAAFNAIEGTRGTGAYAFGVVSRFRGNRVSATRPIVVGGAGGAASPGAGRGLEVRAPRGGLVLQWNRVAGSFADGVLVVAGGSGVQPSPKVLRNTIDGSRGHGLVIQGAGAAEGAGGCVAEDLSIKSPVFRIEGNAIRAARLAALSATSSPWRLDVMGNRTLGPVLLPGPPSGSGDTAVAISFCGVSFKIGDSTSAGGPDSNAFVGQLEPSAILVDGAGSPRRVGFNQYFVGGALPVGSIGPEDVQTLDPAALPTVLDSGATPPPVIPLDPGQIISGP